MVMDVEHRNSNLFIRLYGAFSHASACAVADTIVGQYNGSGNIFINVEKIAGVHPSAPKEFRKRLNSSLLPKHKIYFIGKKGFEISPDDFKIIIRQKRKCSGKCRGCSKKTTGSLPCRKPPRQYAC